MKLRPDGRSYKLLTRRSVAILKRVPKTATDRAKLIKNLNTASAQELYLKRFGRNISEGRLLDYMQFYKELEIVEFSGDDVCLHPDFIVPFNDQQWVNALADQAKNFLARYLQEQGKTVGDRIATALKAIHDTSVSPTPGSLIDRQNIGTNKEKEQFRWALYLYMDGDACPFQLRRKDTLERSAGGTP